MRNTGACAGQGDAHSGASTDRMTYHAAPQALILFSPFTCSPGIPGGPGGPGIPGGP